MTAPTPRSPRRTTAPAMVAVTAMAYTVPVDTSGSPELARARVTGVSDRAARREYEAVWAKMSYRPALLHGCVVRGMATVTLDVP